MGYPIHLREEDKDKKKFISKKRKNRKEKKKNQPTLDSMLSATNFVEDSKKNVANVSLFHVVFALRYCCEEDSEKKIVHTILDISKCAEYVSKTLLYEEKRCGWISSSVTALSYHRERFDEESNNNIDTTTTTKNWTSHALTLSSLARELKDLYVQLSCNKSLDLKWHRWIKLSFVLSNREKDLPTFRPYKTLLLLHDKIRIVRDLPAHASRDLRRIIDAISSFKSLRQLQDETGIQTSEFLRLCAHLVMWGKVRVITTINAKSQYSISPSVNLSLQGKLFENFEKRYGENTFQILARMLRDIASGARFGVILQRELKRSRSNLRSSIVASSLSSTSYSSDFKKDSEKTNKEESSSSSTTINNLSKIRMDMMQWLLRMNVIVEVHEYIYTLYDHNPDEVEAMRLEEAYSRSPQRIREHLRRILPFCDGKHTVEEIIFQSGVPRKAIRTVVQVYPKVLVVCTR